MDSSLTNLKKEITEKSNALSSMMSEVGIDKYADTLKEILDKVSDFVGPIKSVKSLYELTLSIRFKKDLKNLTAFLNSLKSGNVTPNEIEKYAEKYSKSDEALKDDIEKILLILTSYRDEQKSKILGNLYANLIKDKISYEQFQTLTEILNNLLVADIPAIIYLCKKQLNYNVPSEFENSLYRLQALGLIKEYDFTIQTTAINHPRIIILSDGSLLYYYGLIDIKEQ